MISTNITASAICRTKDNEEYLTLNMLFNQSISTQIPALKKFLQLCNTQKDKLCRTNLKVSNLCVSGEDLVNEPVEVNYQSPHVTLNIFYNDIVIDKKFKDFYKLDYILSILCKFLNTHNRYIKTNITFNNCKLLCPTVCVGIDNLDITFNESNGIVVINDNSDSKDYNICINNSNIDMECINTLLSASYMKETNMSTYFVYGLEFDYDYFYSKKRYISHISKYYDELIEIGAIIFIPNFLEMAPNTVNVEINNEEHYSVTYTNYIVGRTYILDGTKYVLNTTNRFALLNDYFYSLPTDIAKQYINKIGIKQF